MAGYNNGLTAQGGALPKISQPPQPSLAKWLPLTSQYIEGKAVQTVNARELHSFLKVGRDFSNWIKDRIAEYGFVEGVDYVVFTKFGENPQGGEGGAGMMDSTHRTASTFRQLPIFAIGLYEDVRDGTMLPATAKSVAEIGVSKLKLEPTHALAWFFVGTRSPFLGALLAYLVGGACRVMAVRARASKEALVSFFTSYANLVRAATRRLASFCGSNKLLKKEAAIMATIPTPVISKRFTFLIASSACRLADLRRIRTVTAVADTEAQARAALAGLPLVFLSRTPTGRAAV